MHTQPNAPSMELLPFYHLDGGVTRKILALPDQQEKDRLNEAGVLIPTGVGITVQHGTVVAVCQGSTISVGDRVAYRPVIRMDGASPLELQIDGITYHHILEQEVWDVNDTPVDRLFVMPSSSTMVTEDGIITPPSHHGLLQYGTVYKAPANSKIKAGDVVAYRLPEVRSYESADIDGVMCDVVPEREILVVNGHVSPKKIIVKIDTLAQRKHQSKNEHGTLLHPNFIHMQRMLQYAKVVEVGEESHKVYPGLATGDYVAIHHTIEHHSYRIVGVERANNGNPIAEYRIIDCNKLEDNEIFAKLDIGRKNGTGEIIIKGIHPYGELHFFEWGFDMLTPHRESLSDSLIDMPKDEFDVSNFKDLERLRLYIDQNKRQATEQYKAPYNQYASILSRLNPEIQEQKDQRDYYEGKIEELKRSADQVGAKLNRNFLLACKIVAPKESDYTHIVTTYKELYPLQIMGKRFLIGYKHFIIGFLKTKDSMAQLENFVPFGTRLLVEVIEETKQSDILIPNELIQERPVIGTVVKVGPGADGVQVLAAPGDTVWFRKGSGVPIKLDDKEYLIFRQNEDLIGYTKKD